MKPKVLSAIRPALQLHVLNCGYVLSHCGLSTLSLYSIDTENCILMLELGRNVRVSAIKACDDSDMLLLCLGYESGEYEQVYISLPIDGNDDEYSIFNDQCMATVVSRQICASFTNAIVSISFPYHDNRVLLMDANGHYAVSNSSGRLDSPIECVGAEHTVFHPFSYCVNSPTIAGGMAANGDTSISSFVGSLDGALWAGLLRHESTGTEDGVLPKIILDISLFQRFDSVVVGAFIVDPHVGEASASLERSLDTFVVVVERTGVVSALRISGEAIAVSHVDLNRHSHYGISSSVKYASMWGGRYLFVLMGFSLYISDSHDSDVRHQRPALQFILASGSASIATMALSDSAIAISLLSGKILVFTTPGSFSGADAGTEEGEVLIHYLMECFSDPSQLDSNSQKAVSIKDPKHLLSIEKQQWKKAIEDEKAIQNSMDELDDRIRKLIALNAVIGSKGHGAVRSSRNLSQHGTINAQFEKTNQHNTPGSVMMRVTLCSTNREYAQAIEGCIASSTLTRKESTSGVNSCSGTNSSYSFPIQFFSSLSNPIVYTASTCYPVDVSDVYPHILSIEVEVPLIAPGLFANANSSPLMTDRPMGYWLHLGSVELQASDILAAIPDVKAMLSSCDDSGLDDEPSQIARHSPSITVKIPHIAVHGENNLTDTAVQPIVRKMKEACGSRFGSVPFRDEISSGRKRSLFGGPSLIKASLDLEIDIARSVKSASDFEGEGNFPLSGKNDSVIVKSRKSMAVNVACSYEIHRALRQALNTALRREEGAVDGFMESGDRIQQVYSSLYALPPDLQKVSAQLAYLMGDISSCSVNFLQASRDANLSKHQEWNDLMTINVSKDDKLISTSAQQRGGQEVDVTSGSGDEKWVGRQSIDRLVELYSNVRNSPSSL